MQLRLFVLVAACMGVLWLATEAAKPGPWRALFGFPEEAQPPAPVQEDVDTKLAGPPGAGDNEPGVVTILDPFHGSLDDEARLKALDPVSRALADGWAAFYQQSTIDERNLIAKAFLAARGAHTLDEADAKPWQELLEKLDRFWADYRANALKSITASSDEPLSDEQKEKWTKVLDRVADAWTADRAVLAKLGQAGALELTATDRDRLRLWQLRWEAFGLAAIEDNTVHRRAELDAWFRLNDILNTTSEKELERLPAERVNFVQLFKQPDEYRGKLIRFRGRIMQAKKIKSARNVYGIESHYMLWINPEGGPKKPIIVYALQLPQGFPSLDDPTLEGEYTRLREDAEITGYFFKKWAYRAKNGSEVAPLILAKSPHWFPTADVTRESELPSMTVFLSWVGGSGLIAVAAATLAWWLSRAPSPALESFQTSDLAQQELDSSLKNAQTGPSVMEQLRELEQRDQGSSS
jgi:hypothetical protein